MSKDPIITLNIHSKELTPEQLNCIVSFVSRFDFENPNQIEIICDSLPLRLNGKISHLSSNAREYFSDWNRAGTMRNIRVLKKEVKC